MIGPLTLDDIAVREVTNGMWFMSNLFLLATLLRYLVPRVIEQPWFWRSPADVRLAWALTLIVGGSTLRSGWIWLLLIAQSSGWERMHAVAQLVNPIAFVAIVLVFWGTVCAIKVLSGPKGSWYWVLVLGASTVIPVVAYTML